jgi:hypothetical protein
MVTDPKALATAEDIALLKVDIHGFAENILKQLESFYITIGQMDEKITAHKQETGQWKDEILRHFDVVAETLEHNLLGAFRDHTSVNANRFTAYDQRITRLERHTGLLSR